MNKPMLSRDQVIYRHEWRHAHLDLHRLPQKRFLSKAEAREAAVMLMHQPASPDEDLEQTELQQAVHEALESIPDKFAEALTLYFCLDGSDGNVIIQSTLGETRRSLQQVARLIGCKASESVRRRIAKGMRLMKHPVRAKKLQEYL